MNPANTRKQRNSLYIVAVIFFVGVIRGIYSFAQGELPLVVTPLLVVPLFLAGYCFKVARHNFPPKPKH
jgi:hypothetical protein